MAFLTKKTFLGIIGLLILATATFFVWSLRQAFNNAGGWTKFAWPAAAALILGIFFGLGWLVADGSTKKLAVIFALVAGLPFMLFFWHNFLMLIVALAAMFFFWLAWWRGAREKQASFKIFLHKILQAGLSLFFTGLALMIASFYYSANIDEVRRGDFEVLQQNEGFGILGDLVLRTVSGQKAKNLSFNQTVDQFLTQLLEQQTGLGDDVLSNNRLAPSFQHELDLLKQEVSQNYGVSLRGDQTVASVVRVFINDKVKTAFGPYQQYIPLIFALAMFLALKAVGFIYAWVVVFCSWVLYRALLLSRIIVLATETAEKENIILRKL
ncbi:MAG: hypothetical protein COU85_00965 [Candidatus Portnoybacteria bacterium CG10_big_fil_rev_8_21_14_0_10_44_7]|uniref:Uncharacterized protein n=1 Tax=Candidatus Portnoybacteria bacterium CG10_big_fil_rev_8_21_14_0_10_44_7 TaxID=1974816 RepID=A0A2M8KJ32_9BACT|nr:MAG: hypothetical protein COU85_00965 [Candidatus Portnoybacteria bacterium CG10_big_fil_rev_8_21_14_0_10_44_7]